MPELSNEELAEQFLELAKLLEQQGANPYRAGAYHSAAQTDLLGSHFNAALTTFTLLHLLKPLPQ